MKILVTLPDSNYYSWQLLVQLTNFKKLGYLNDVIVLVGKETKRINKNTNKILKSELLKKDQYFVFTDERVDKSYSASLKPYLVKKFLQETEGKYGENYLLVDPDLLFINPIFFNKYLNDDIWYCSDTRSYLNSIYIKSKSDMLFTEMCEIVGIDENLVINNDENCGGAQLLFKTSDYKIWEKIENDSVILYNHMIKTSSKYSPKSPIQAWTAEMWSTIWNAWNFGFKTKIVSRFDFVWATDKYECIDKRSFYHNAGALSTNPELFVKSSYQKSPFGNIDFSHVSKNFASYFYLDVVKQTELIYPNLIW